MEKMTSSWALRLDIILVSELSPNYYFIIIDWFLIFCLLFIVHMHVHAHTTACVEIKTQRDGVFKGLILFFHHVESRDLNSDHQA